MYMYMYIYTSRIHVLCNIPAKGGRGSRLTGACSQALSLYFYIDIDNMYSV